MSVAQSARLFAENMEARGLRVMLPLSLLLAYDCIIINELRIDDL